MERKCFRCKKTIANDDFICPHCGAILGDPISYSDTAKSSGKIKSKHIKHWAMIALLAAAAVAVALAVCWCVKTWTGQPPAVSTGPSGTTIPTPPQTTAPLTVYTAHFQTESNTSLTGALAHVYLADQLIYTGTLDKNGDVTFILPEGEGYSIRLTELPAQYQVNYTDVEFPFPDGGQVLFVTLEDKPIAFKIRVVNSAGQPLPGTGIIFSSTGDELRQEVTDSDGYCTFVAKYENGHNTATVNFVPNGYVDTSQTVTFSGGRLEAEIKLPTFEENGFEPKDIYTVRVLDEYGEPASSVILSIVGNGLLIDVSVYVMGRTNLEGCFSFIGHDDFQYSVTVLQNADYYDTVFSFDPGTQEMLLQLDLHQEPGTLYTYTVSFMDFSDKPIPGVEIGVPSWFDDSVVDFYTSDENGLVTFQTTEADPTKVSFYVNNVPDGYFTDRPEYEVITFLAYNRSTAVRLYYDGEVNYTVYVLDDAGKSVASAELYIWKNGRLYIITDAEGKTKFRGIPAEDWEFTIQYLPEPYTNYVIKMIDYREKHCIYITIAPPSDGDT